jgi:hypothetical protein
MGKLDYKTLGSLLPILALTILNCGAIFSAWEKRRAMRVYEKYLWGISSSLE